MKKIKDNIFNLIGKTPIVELKKYTDNFKLYGKIFAKLEWFNPTGSIKDRIAENMIKSGIKKGEINKDTILIEATSGNTGIALAFISSIKNLKLIIIMPENMSKERTDLIKIFGAKIFLTKASLGMNGSIEKANILNNKILNSIVLNQFENPANSEAHKIYTGNEIINSFLNNKLDFFISGVGTGGTLTGVGEVLKYKYPKIKIIAVEPELSSVISGGKHNPHKIEGIGAGFIPKNLNTNIIDEVIKIKDDEAYETVRKIAKIEGYMIGISSGAVIHASEIIARRKENKEKKILVVLPDGINKYFSRNLFF